MERRRMIGALASMVGASMLPAMAATIVGQAAPGFTAAGADGQEQSLCVRTGAGLARSSQGVRGDRDDVNPRWRRRGLGPVATFSIAGGRCG